MCSICNGTGVVRKFGQVEYARLRHSNEEWLEKWPEDEPDIKCDHPQLPDYLNDLNAMHEAEKRLDGNGDLLHNYSRYINEKVVEDGGGAIPVETIPKRIDRYRWHATAPQRAEALLRTIGKWVD